MRITQSLHTHRDHVTPEPTSRARMRPGWRRIAGSFAILTSSAAVVLGAASAAQADPYPDYVAPTVFAYPTLNVHPGDPIDGPDMSRIIGEIQYGTRIIVDCQVSGPAETGADGTTTTLWDRVVGYNGNDPAAWVSDAWVDTGSSDRVVSNNAC